MLETESLEVRSGDARLFARVYGRGLRQPAVVMIPSLGRGAADFDRLGAELAGEGYTAASFDQRGIGASTGPLDGLELGDLARDAAAVGRALHAGRFVAAGHGFGNGTARRLAALYTEEVAGVVAINAGGKIHDPDPRVYEVFDEVFEPGVDEKTRRAAISESFFAGGRVPQEWIDGWWPEPYRAYVTAQDAAPLPGWWTAGNAPILIIQGLRDRVAPPENGHDVKALAGDRATVVDLADASHAILPQRPEAVAKAVLAFLDGLRSS